MIVSARSLIEGSTCRRRISASCVASSSSPRQRIQRSGDPPQAPGLRRRGEDFAYLRALHAGHQRRDDLRKAELGSDDRPRSKSLLPLGSAGASGRAGWPSEGGDPRRDGDRSFDTRQSGIPIRAGTRGEEFSTDRLGNVLAPGGAVALNPSEVPGAVERLRGGPGRFRVTPRRRRSWSACPHVRSRPGGPSSSDQLALVEDDRPAQLAMPDEAGEEWVTLFAGVLEQPFEFPSAEAGNSRRGGRNVSRRATRTPVP